MEIKEMKTILSRWVEKLPKYQLFLLLALIWGVVLFLSHWIGPKIAESYPCKKEFFANIYVEAFGLIFDILFFGLLLTIYENLREQRDKINRYHEEIDDYRPWQEKEATYRIIGNLKRLQKAKVKNADINLSGCYLSESSMMDLDLSNINLKGAILVKADIVNLEGANLENARLEAAMLTGANLKKANLSHAILMGANLISIEVDGKTNLDKTTLTGAKIDEQTWNKIMASGAIGVDWIMKNYELRPAPNWFSIQKKSTLMQN